MNPRVALATGLSLLALVLAAAWATDGPASLEFERGEALSRIGRYAEAVLSYRQAVVLDPRNPRFRLALGVAYRHVGYPDYARQCFARVIALAPGSFFAREAERYLRESEPPRGSPQEDLSGAPVGPTGAAGSAPTLASRAFTPPGAGPGNWANLAAVGNRLYLSYAGPAGGDGHAVWIREYDRAGTPTGRALHTADGTNVTDHRMAATPDGRLFLTWSTRGDRDLFVASVSLGNRLAVEQTVHVVHDAPDTEPTNDMLVGAGPRQLYVGTLLRAGRVNGDRVRCFDGTLSVVADHAVNDVAHENGGSVTAWGDRLYLVSSHSSTRTLLGMRYDTDWHYQGVQVLLRSERERLFWPSAVGFVGSARYLAVTQGPDLFRAGRIWLCCFNEQWQLAWTLPVSSSGEKAHRPGLLVDGQRIIVVYDRENGDGSYSIAGREYRP